MDIRVFTIRCPQDSKIPRSRSIDNFKKPELLGINENIHLSLSFAPNMSKIFNKVQEISSFEVWVTTGHINDKYEPQEFFDHKNKYIFSKKACNDVK